MRRFRHFKIFAGGMILTGLVICGIAAPVIAPHNPQEQRLEARLQPPSWTGGAAAK